MNLILEIKSILLNFVLIIIWLPYNLYTAEFTFVHITDDHIPVNKGVVHLSSAVAEINSLVPPPVWVIDTGDFTETGFANEYEKYLSLMQKLNLTFYPTLGNHETAWTDTGKERFRKYFQHRYRSLIYQNVHFIILDTSIIGEQHGHIDKEQIVWLTKELHNIGTTKPILLFSHHPPVMDKGEGFIDNLPALWEIIKDYNIRVWFTGHGHRNYRWKWNGINFVMTKAVLAGGYRIVKVDDTEIRMFTKDIAAEPVADIPEISLSTRTDKFTGKIISPVPNSFLTVPLECKVKVTDSVEKVQCKVNSSQWYDLSLDTPSSTWSVSVSTAFPAGKHQFTVRVTEKSGITPTIPAIQEHYIPLLSGEKYFRWTVSTTAPIRSKPVLSNGTVYFTSEDGNIYAISTDTGKLIWQFSAGGPITTTPVVNETTVFTGSHDGNLYAMDIFTGSIKWKYPAGVPILSSPTLIPDKNQVVFAAGDGTVYCIDGNKGTSVWQYKTDKHTYVRPLYYQNHLFFGTWDQNFRCLDTTTGTLVWQQKIGRSVYFAPARSSPANSTDMIYFTSPENKVYAVSASSGGIIWTVEAKSGYSSPAVSEDKVYVGSLDGNVHCFSATDGTLKWTVKLGYATYDSSPVIHNRKLYIASLDGTLNVLDAQTGGLLWQYHVTDGYTFATVSVDDATVYLASMDGNLYAITQPAKLTSP